MTDRYEYPDVAMWYVAHTYSNYEDKVKTNLEKSIRNLNLQDQILDVRVPVEEVDEIRDGVRKTVQRKLFPGYVLVHMIMNDETWYVVRNTRGVTGFVGPESNPVPLAPEEMLHLGITDSVSEEKTDSENESARRVEIDLEEGDFVTIISGNWEGYEGVVKAVNTENLTVKVGLNVFSRETPVENISVFDVRKKN